MEWERYLRQLILPQVGVTGQERLRRARVLLIGLGGLGSPLAYYLVAAGVGRLGMVEYDRVELSNLHRQILYTSSDVGRSKLEVARERLRILNPEVELLLFEEPFGPENADRILEGFDVVADGSDNFPTRYAASDACVRRGIPYVYGSLYRFQGQVGVLAGGGPCYRCLYPEPPRPDQVPGCGEVGLLGPLAGVVGSLQALEVLKWILGTGDVRPGRLLHIDGLKGEFSVFTLERDPNCPVCSGAGSGAPRAEEFQEPAPHRDPETLYLRLRSGEAPLLVDVRGEEERRAGHLGGIWIPWEELARRLQELEPYRDRELLIYCERGERSAQVVRWLRGLGFSQVYNLAGGLSAWRRAGFPLQPG
nr:MAG: molybdenum cofactor biosynthesis protein MoeB [Bacteroidota bacterium]